MRLSALNRLRLAFLGIGVLLLLPLGLLAHSVTARLEAQRRLRHEVVADRIFDELERELTTVLSQELARPSAAYDSPSGPVDAAPSYVLGYSTSTGDHPRLAGPEQAADGPAGGLTGGLTGGKDEKERRVRWALGEWDSRNPKAIEPLPAGGVPAPATTTGSVERSRAAPKSQQAKPASAPQSSPEILKKLNRGDQTREDLGY